MVGDLAANDKKFMCRHRDIQQSGQYQSDTFHYGCSSTARRSFHNGRPK